MSWTPLDKISFEQLNSQLQDIIDNKAGGTEFATLSSKFESHLVDKETHLTPNDRYKLGYVFERVVNTLDAGVEQSIMEFNSTVKDIQAHMRDDQSHWTSLDRNDYNLFRTNLETTLDDLQQQIDALLTNANSIFVDNSTYSETVTNLANHILDPHKHVTPKERETWNSMLGDAKDYTDRELYSHSIDSAKHISDAEREDWNAHKDNVTIHLTPEERGLYNNHVNNGNIHVTHQQKNNWNSMKNKLDMVEESLSSLSNTVAVMNNALANLQTKVAQLSLLV